MTFAYIVHCILCYLVIFGFNNQRTRPVMKSFHPDDEMLSPEQVINYTDKVCVSCLHVSE